MSAEKILESFMFNSRWLLVPFYLGLIVGMVLLLGKFGVELVHLVGTLPEASTGELIVGILALIDLSLVASLLLIIIFSGYENFVSKMDTGDNEDRPDWMGHVDFSDLKLKVIGSIVAISAIELLKSFIKVGDLSNEQLAWKVGIHLTFVVSGVLFALMDRIGEKH
ncbi:MAG: TIGR00645 family protein [Thiohalorhabdus sp.]|uniref:TIGR00645 family protein n=1 Tax=Thiohalorhabdus sp. TaxID=3094134 RepID=UPI00397FA258